MSAAPPSLTRLLRSRDLEVVQQGLELVEALGPGTADLCLAELGGSRLDLGSGQLVIGGPLRLSPHRGVVVLGLLALGESLRRCVTLDLSGLGLSRLPASLFPLPQLQCLDLSRNRLSTLPPDVGALPALRVLRCSENQLTTLPSLAGLTQLEQLVLRSNQLSALPDVGSLPRLSYLSLAGNRLQTVDLTGFRALRTLDLASNQLSRIEHLGSLQQLRRLTLDGNRLFGLPPELGRLARLERVSAPCNQLRSLPEGLSQLSRLRHLDLTRNQLEWLPADFSAFPALRTCDLKRNRLAALDGVPDHAELEIAFNPLLELAPALQARCPDWDGLDPEPEGPPPLELLLFPPSRTESFAGEEPDWFDQPWEDDEDEPELLPLIDYGIVDGTTIWIHTGEPEAPVERAFRWPSELPV